MQSWTDPYIGYKGYALNATLIEDDMWELYNEEQAPRAPQTNCIDQRTSSTNERASRSRRRWKSTTDELGPGLKPRENRGLSEEPIPCNDVL